MQQPEQQTVMVEQRPVCCRILQPSPATPGENDALRFPVLLLHGLGCSADAWGPTMRALGARSTGQTACAPDFPGYGDSPGPRAALGMAELADWTVRLIDQLSVAKAHLAGHSMGCQVALELARRHPSRVGGIVLVGPTTGERRVPYWRYAVGLVLDGFREPPRYNAVLLKMYAQMGLPRYLATVRKMMEDEPLAYAEQVTTPCLVLRGEHDQIVPDRVARELAERLPQGRFVQVAGAAHALQYHKPTDFVNLALPFWRQAASAD